MASSKRKQRTNIVATSIFFQASADLNPNHVGGNRVAADHF
jgi:hypothetical protein